MVGAIPNLKRKIATAAASASSAAHGLMLASTGQSKASGPWSTRMARANKAWTANHKARLAMTPTAERQQGDPRPGAVGFAERDVGGGHQP